VIGVAARATGVPLPPSFKRTSLRGKLLATGTETLWIKGVTYGTFQPESEVREYNPERVEADFCLMQENHINAIRLYTMPDRWMLDLAQSFGIRILAGFAWEQNVTFLDQKSTARSIRKRLQTSLREIVGHPALLACSIGNEIPSGIVRWHGAKRIQKHLHSLYETAKECDPDLLVTYVSYPTTEYLHLPFLDFLSFNVFLESSDEYEPYLYRLQNLAGNKPLLLTEIGLDSRRKGLERQSELLYTQIRASYGAGCAGVFVYSWTDEWFRGGQEIFDWDFGLTTRERLPKPALHTVAGLFGQQTLDLVQNDPRISVVVCSYNGSRTIDQCLESLFRLDYTNYEVIVIDDGSTDATAEIASKYPVRLIRTSNHGLSAARNRGLAESTGEIIAYIDDDAYADPNWLRYLAITFQDSNYACIGGPNFAPPEDGLIAQCVARAPGGPVHVLNTDREAEHVPGCNLAIRAAVLRDIGGFDPQFRAAGDDVDLCWRLTELGYKIGFHPAAFVWHHRRNSISMYVKQQRGYGKAEALLARKWPEKYNLAGHVSWGGRIYHNGWFSPGRIYSGIWGSAPFQSLYQRAPGMLGSILSWPEWNLLVLALFIVSLLSLEWAPLTYVIPVLAGSIALPVIRALHQSVKSLESVSGPKTRLILINSLLHLLQPVSRLIGRLPIWRPQYARFTFPRNRIVSIWSYYWQDASEKLGFLLEKGKSLGGILSAGDSFGRWDLQATGGAFGSARLLIAIEDHGQGKQLTRFHIYRKYNPFWLVLCFVCFLVGVIAMLDQAWITATIFLGFAIFLAVRFLYECGRAIDVLMASIQLLEKNEELRFC
jgi:glycosyltransferase involved in cell wall biosynthesis